MKDLKLVASLELNTHDKGVQMLSHFRFLLHSIDKDLAGLVVDPSDEVDEALA